MELATALHHSAQRPRPVVEEPREEAGHETYCGLRAPMPLPLGTRPAPLSDVAGPQRSDLTARHFAVEPPFPGRVVLVQEPVAHDNTTTRFLLEMALLQKEEVRKREEEELKRIRNIPLNQLTPLQRQKLVCWMDKEKEKAKAAVGILPSTSSSSSGFSRKRKKKEEEKDEAASLILFDVLLRPLVSGSHFRYWSCLRCTVYGLFWEITSGMVSVCDTPWFDSGYLSGVGLRGFLAEFHALLVVSLGDDFKIVSVFSAVLRSTADTYLASVSEASALSLVRQRIHALRSPWSFWKNFTIFSCWALGDDFKIVSVFSAELGSTADTCLASVYEAFWKNFTLFSCCWALGDDFTFVSVFSAELGSFSDTCTASVYELFEEAHIFSTWW